MTIPDEAVQAAVEAVDEGVNWVAGLFGEKYDNADEVMKDALTAALPFLQGVKVDGAKIEAVRKPVEELANTQMNLSLDDWSRISSTILSAIEPAPPPCAHELEEAARKAQKAIAAILSSGGLESDKWWDDLVSAQQSLAAAIRALSSQEPVCVNSLDDARRKAFIEGFEDAVTQADNVVNRHDDTSKKEVINGIRALTPDFRSLLSQPLADGWLPVGEDTPKDTVVLLSWRYQGNWEYEAGLYGSTSGGWLHGQASHWRHLPPSPGASE